MIEPTQGRIVYYHEGKVVWPAMVVNTYTDNPRLVDLKVFTNSDVHSRPRVQLLQDDDKPATTFWAEWMPYQKGQAAKSDADLAEVQAALKNMADLVDGVAAELKTIKGQTSVVDDLRKQVQGFEERLKGVFAPDPLAPISSEKKA